MKSINSITIILLACIIASCEKQEPQQPAQPGHCYECTVDTATERTDGRAWDLSTTKQTHCNLSEHQANKLEKGGTWKKQQPDRLGLNLVWVDQKTTCRKI